MRPPTIPFLIRCVSAFAVLGLVLAFAPAIASASDDEDDEGAPAEPVMEGDRECYSGINFSAGFSVDPDGSFSPGGGARIGCRFSGLFAAEFEVEGLDELAGSPHDRIAGFGSNVLAFLPLYAVSPFFDRLQPFVFGGIDFAYSRFVGFPKEETKSSIAWSAGLGTRFYIDETFALDLRGKWVNHAGGQRLTYTQLDIGFTYDFYAY